MPGVVGQPNQTYTRVEFVSSIPPETYAIDQLRQEVDAAGLSVNLLLGDAGFSCSFVSVTLHFNGNLDAGDVADLDALVAAHTGVGIVQLDDEGPVVVHAPGGPTVFGFEPNVGTVDMDMSGVGLGETVEYVLDANAVPAGTDQVLIVHDLVLGATFQVRALNGFINSIPDGDVLPLSSAMYSMIRVPGGWRIGQSPLP